MMDSCLFNACSDEDWDSEIRDADEKARAERGEAPARDADKPLSHAAGLRKMVRVSCDVIRCAVICMRRAQRVV